MKSLDKIIAGVSPVLESLEVDRQNYYRKRSNCIWFIILPLLCFSGILTYYFFPVGAFSLIPVILISVIAYHFMVSKVANSFAGKYKDCVVTKLVEEIDPNLSFDLARGIDMTTFVTTELFNTRPDKYHTEDLIHGAYKEMHLQLAEIHARETRRSSSPNGKNLETQQTIFEGLLLIADFHKHFRARTFVLPDVAEKALGGLGRTLQKMGGRSGTELIQLEDAEFEHEFSVHSSDEVEAKSILSASMMRRVLDLKKDFGPGVRLAFKDSCVIVAVPHGKTYLEPSIRVPANDSTQVEKMLQDIAIFIQIIEELDLNNKIWTKQ